MIENVDYINIFNAYQMFTGKAAGNQMLLELYISV